MLLDIIDHGVDVDQDFTTLFGVLDDDPIFPVEQDDELQGVDGVEPQALAEQGLVIRDVCGRGGGEVQELYDLFF